MTPRTCRWTLVTLILLQPLWFFWLAPPELMPPWLATLLMALPLLLVLPFAWQLGRNALVVAGGILLLHFCVAVAEAWANPAARIPALIQIVLVVLYLTAMSALRFGRRAAEPAGPQP